MANSSSQKPTQTDTTSTALGKLGELPPEVVIKVMLSLNSPAIMNGFMRTCRTSRKFFFNNFKHFLIHFNPKLTSPFQVLDSTALPMEALRIIHRFEYPPGTDGTSKQIELDESEKTPRQTETNKSSLSSFAKQEPSKTSKLPVPRCIPSWSDGSPIPEDVFVIVLTDSFDEKIDFEKIQSLIVISKNFENDNPDVGSTLKQNLPSLKRLGFYGISFCSESYDNMKQPNLDFVCLNNCYFHDIAETETKIFCPKTLYIEPHWSNNPCAFRLDHSLEKLTVCYRRSLHHQYRGLLWLHLDDCCSLKEFELSASRGIFAYVKLQPPCDSSMDTLNFNCPSEMITLCEPCEKFLKGTKKIRLAYRNYSLWDNASSKKCPAYWASIPEENIDYHATTYEEWHWSYSSQ